MNENAIQTAHNPAAPEDERQDALRIAQSDAMPSSVPDLTELVRFVAEQHQEEQFTKSLSKPNLIPFPSRAVREGQPGMQSVFIDDQRVQMLGEWYERPSAFTFDTMRSMVDNTPILSAIIMTRIRQVRRFCRANSLGRSGPGFQIALRDSSGKLSDQERESIRLLEGFFTNCGWESNPRQRMRLKRDNFSGLMAKLVRDSLIMDSAPIETEYKRDRALGLDGLYAVDGSTIRLCTEQGYQGDDEVFALQVVDGQIRACYTYDDLIYVPRNPTTSVLAGGYGQAETELLVRVVTGFLNALTYNLKFFDSNAIPKGLLHLTGDYSQDDLASFKRYWNSMVRGINNAWTLPVMVSKNQESKASFENFGVDTTDAMFTKWMTFLTAIACAIYGIAPDEINFESFTNGTSSLSGSDTEEKIINSKDKGLRPLLAHFEDLFSDYVVAEFGDKYMFRWTGLDDKPPQEAWTEEQALLTVNEARANRNLDEIKEAWGNAPLHPNLIGLFQSEQQGNQEDYGDPSQAPEFGGQDADQPPAKDGQPDAGEQDAPEQEQPEDEQPEQDAPAPAKDEQALAKAFGLPVFKVQP